MEHETAIDQSGALQRELLPPDRATAVRTPRSDRRNWRGYRLRRLLLAADIAALFVAFTAAELYDVAASAGTAFSMADVIRLLLGVPAWLAFAHVHNLYHVENRRADHGIADEVGPILQMVTLWVWLMLLVASAAGVKGLEVAEFAVFWAVALSSELAFRAGVRSWSRSRSWYVERAVVVGPPNQAQAAARKLRRHPEYGICVVATLDMSSENATPPREAHVATPDPADSGLFDLIEELDVDRVIVAWWPGSADERFELIDRLADANVNVDLVPSWFELLGLKLELHQMEGAPLLRVPSRRLGRSSLLVKRAFDLVVTSVALVLLSPLLLVALAIKLDDRGPVLFRQRRVGKDGERFELLKFRSMATTADDLKGDVSDLNIHGGGLERGMFKVREDPRVTRVGRWLRRTSIDELPQLWNVLRGDMSLVGARPLIEEEDSQIQGRLCRRRSLTPGLTGLWQAHGRAEIPFETMLNLDYLYATSWSLWGDVKILIRTVSAVFRGHGAY